jgi:hypothetical protein
VIVRLFRYSPRATVGVQVRPKPNQPSQSTPLSAPANTYANRFGLKPDQLRHLRRYARAKWTLYVAAALLEAGCSPDVTAEFFRQFPTVESVMDQASFQLGIVSEFLEWKKVDGKCYDAIWAIGLGLVREKQAKEKMTGETSKVPLDSSSNPNQTTEVGSAETSVVPSPSGSCPEVPLSTVSPFVQKCFKALYRHR